MHVFLIICNQSLNETTHGYCAQEELQLIQTKISILHRVHSFQKVRVLPQISLWFAQFGYEFSKKYALIIANNETNSLKSPLRTES